jgi:hypothetical protein
LKNTCSLLESIAQLEDDKGQERELIEVWKLTFSGHAWEEFLYYLADRII